MIHNDLPPNWIDASIGEAEIIKESLFNTINGGHLVHINEECNYNIRGYRPLVQLLEEKHDAPVIITNGAKQALGAAFYLLKTLDKIKLGLNSPYWSLIPPLALFHGLAFYDDYNAFLSVMPNNPNGSYMNYDAAKSISDIHKEKGIPFIHDAAYYTPTYFSNDYTFGPLGDLQIFSASKMFGISGLRIGYIVCHNKDYYNTIIEYLEMMTVGVSIASQKIFHSILHSLQEKDKYNKFVSESRNKIKIAKALCLSIRKDILEVPLNIQSIPGIFGWFKIMENCNFEKANIHVVNGKLFGDESMVRLNLGMKTNTLIEMIERVNSL